MATEEGTKEIETGLELAQIISENIENLIDVMNVISKNVGEIIVSSNQINIDSKATDGFMKEISKMLEDSKKIVSENDVIFEKIELTSHELKESI